jgi:hypothetical protein
MDLAVQRHTVGLQFLIRYGRSREKKVSNAYTLGGISTLWQRCQHQWPHFIGFLKKGFGIILWKLKEPLESSGGGGSFRRIGGHPVGGGRAQRMIVNLTEQQLPVNIRTTWGPSQNSPYASNVPAPESIAEWFDALCWLSWEGTTAEWLLHIDRKAPPLIHRFGAYIM